MDRRFQKHAGPHALHQPVRQNCRRSSGVHVWSNKAGMVGTPKKARKKSFSTFPCSRTPTLRSCTKSVPRFRTALPKTWPNSEHSSFDSRPFRAGGPYFSSRWPSNLRRRKHCGILQFRRCHSHNGLLTRQNNANRCIVFSERDDAFPAHV